MGDINLSHQTVPAFKGEESYSGVLIERLKDSTRHKSLDEKLAQNQDF